jgi:hypothetical protein
MAHYITVKFGNMRGEAQRFIVYPYSGGDTVLLQSSKRIARVNLRTGQTILSRQVQGGAYAPHLYPEMGATLVQFPSDKLTELQGYLWHNEGKAGNICGVVHYSNSELFSK